MVRRVLDVAGVAKLLSEGSDRTMAVEDRTIETLLRARHRYADDNAADGLRRLAIEHGHPLVAGLARRYRGRGEPIEDLVQVASLGLIKAVDGYDTERGTGFNGYAVPTIIGELKRYFRDKGWYIRVPRRLQEIRLDIVTARDVLSQQLGRAPTVAEMAAHVGATHEEVLAAMDASQAYRPTSLSTPVNGDDEADGILADQVGAVEDGYGMVEYRETLRPLVAALPVRQQRILALRFYGNLTQAQIADKVGISQMHVSRLLADALVQLRRGLLVD